MKTAKLSTALAAVGLALAATVVSAPVATAESPTAHLLVHNTVLTNQDNGRTVTVRTGDLITVRLKGSRTATDLFAWREPAAVDGKILVRKEGREFPDGDAVAVFKAAKSGSTRIGSNEACVPAPGHFCPFLLLVWRATVDVK